jgi:1-acyl-sn-glycerol-3-phosphate acyltransferase
MVEIGLVPFGSIGLTLFGLDLAWASPTVAVNAEPLSSMALLAIPGTWHVLFDLAAIGLFGGLFIVPLYALVQLRSNTAHRARIIAANNIVNALFMVVGAMAAAGLLSAGLSVPALFAVAAVCNAAVAIYIYKLVPEFLVRFVVWLLIHSVYRLDKQGLENIPESGPAVLICNHVSFVDALIIAAASRRPIRFVMDHHIFRWPILSFVFKAGRAIPIAPEKEDANLKQKAFDEVSKALSAGELVCIFPEGRITATGEMSVFRPGINQILARNPVPVVPMGLTGLWGSLFSRAHASFVGKLWKVSPLSKVVLKVGARIEGEQLDLDELKEKVMDLCGRGEN